MREYKIMVVTVVTGSSGERRVVTDVIAFPCADDARIAQKRINETSDLQFSAKAILLF